MDVGLLHHRDQRPFGPFPWLQQRRDEAAGSDPGNLQLNAPDPRVPASLPVAVPLPGPLRRALMPVGTQLLAEFKLHQRLAQDPHSLSQDVDISLELDLAQQLLQCDAQAIGHGGGLLSVSDDSTDENHALAVLVNSFCLSTHSLGL